LDGVDEDLEAQRVPAMVVLVSGDLGAGARSRGDGATRGASRPRLSWPVDPGAERGVGAVAQQEVGADDPAVLAERDSERALRHGVPQARDQQARWDPAALERRGRSQQVVVLLDDPFRPGPRSQDDVDR
jgi:hypothetical protein